MLFLCLLKGIPEKPSSSMKPVNDETGNALFHYIVLYA